MRGPVAEVLSYRYLLVTLARRDIKVRYKQSVMGLLWALLVPTMIVASGLLMREVFSFVSGVPVRVSDLVGVSVKALPWAFFVGAVRFATVSLTSNSNLVTEIYFPREVFPLAAVLAHLFDFAVALPILIGLLVLAGVGASAELLWVPVLLAILTLLAAGVGMLTACGNLFFRDVKYIVDALLTYGVFLTPVFYDVEMLGRFGKLILLNPVAPILDALNRVVVLGARPDPFWLTYAAAWAAFGFLAAWWIFDRAECRFAESI